MNLTKILKKGKMSSTEEIFSAKILILDDDQFNVDLLETMLTKAGFNSMLSSTDPRQAIEIYKAYQPHLAILDINMPYLNGYQVMEEFKKIEGNDYIPVLAVTGLQDDKTCIKALESGAQDFIRKPFKVLEVITRVRNMIKVRLLHIQAKNQNVILEQQVLMRTRELEDSRLEIIHKLGQASEYRDSETGNHIIRMSRMSAYLGKLTNLSDQKIDFLLNASPMHDVGKIGIPDQILLKPGPLDSEEWKTMKQHTVIGGKLLGNNDSELMKMARDIAINHHEKWDGTGYPNGLKGKKISIYARIAAIADVFDALTSKRPYKKAFPIEKGVTIIREERDRHFDPELVDLFLDNIDGFVKIKQKYSRNLNNSGEILSK